MATLLFLIVFAAWLPIFPNSNDFTLPETEDDPFRLTTTNYRLQTKGKVRNYEFVISEEVRSPDGVERTMILANGQFPGPTLHANVGDTLRILVHNQLHNSTSLHWHGLHQRGTNRMDGVPGVTQCGIASGSSFLYEFTLTQTGTYWWHSHSQTQRLDGLFGALIVHGAGEAYQMGRDYDEEVVVLLQDYYHTPAPDMLAWYLTRASSGFEPVPDNGLINGQNVFECSRKIGMDCMDGGNRHEFHFRRNMRYRLRLINTGAVAGFNFSIEGHPMQVIEADGVDVHPIDIDAIPIAPAQRYSVLIDSSNVGSTFFMRAEMENSCFNYFNKALDRLVKAIIRYGDDSERLDDSNTPLSYTHTLQNGVCRDLDASLLSPVDAIDAPAPDVRHVIWAMTMRLEHNNLAPYGFINRTSFQPAVGAPNLLVEQGVISESELKTPSVSGMIPNTAKYGGSQLITPIPLGYVVEMVINNVDQNPHPFHLHGHHFWVLHTHEARVGLGNWRPGKIYNTKNPARRDTIIVPAYGHAVIRWVADNPGMDLYCILILIGRILGISLSCSMASGHRYDDAIRRGHKPYQ